MALDLPWYKVRQDMVKLPNGKIMDDYMVSVRDDFAAVFPIVDNDKVIVVTQYKHGIQKITTEFPAGFIEKGEDPADAARRKLLEETGHHAENMTKLLTLAENSTKNTNWIHIYLAKDAVKVSEQQLDKHGETEIEVRIIALTDLWAMIQNGEIEAAPMVATALHALVHLGNFKP